MILLILAIAMVGIMAYAYVITRAQAFLCLVAAGVLIAVAIIASRLHAIDFWGRDVFAQAMMGMAMVLGGWGWARLFTADQDARVKLLRAMIPSVASQRRDTSPFTIELGALAFVVIGIVSLAWWGAVLLGALLITWGVELGLSSYLFLRRWRRC